MGNKKSSIIFTAITALIMIAGLLFFGITKTGTTIKSVNDQLIDYKIGEEMDYTTAVDALSNLSVDYIKFDNDIIENDINVIRDIMTSRKTYTYTGINADSNGKLIAVVTTRDVVADIILLEEQNASLEELHSLYIKYNDLDFIEVYGTSQDILVLKRDLDFYTQINNFESLLNIKKPDCYKVMYAGDTEVIFKPEYKK